RVGTSNIESVGIVDPDVFTFSDKVNPSESSDAMLCYYIVATSNIILNSSVEESIRSQSNTICIEQPTGVLAPNAFAPAGINYEFRPLLIFGEAAEYQMTIWDRWGQKIFETEDILVGWTGRQGFRELPAAVYTYQIQVKQMSGRVVEETGTVTLVR
ncbi:MAG: gliding motility-associated-like protein, partial [Patescibacteria group bacterium]